MYTVVYYSEQNTSVTMRAKSPDELVSYQDILEKKKTNTPIADGSKSFTLPSSVNDTLSLSFPPHGPGARLDRPVAMGPIWVPVYKAGPDDDHEATDHGDEGTESYPGTPGGDDTIEFTPYDIVGEIPPTFRCGGDGEEGLPDIEDGLTGEEGEGYGDIPGVEGGLTGDEFEGHNMPEGSDK